MSRVLLALVLPTLVVAQAGPETDSIEMTLTIQTEEEAVGKLLRAATLFGNNHTVAWEDNTVLYVAWRMNKAAIMQSCFFGKGGNCLIQDMTDRDLIMAAFNTVRQAELTDPSYSAALAEGVHPGIAHLQLFVARVLKPNLTFSYRSAEESLRAQTMQPTPRLVYAYLAALARRHSEMEGIDTRGWSSEETLGWLLLYHPLPLEDVEPMFNLAALLADTKIPSIES